MSADARPSSHIAEAGRVARAVLRAPMKFSDPQILIANRILFWLEREPARIHKDEEIQDALEGMHDLAMENGLI